MTSNKKQGKTLTIVPPVVVPLAPVSLVESVSKVLGFRDAGGELVFITDDQLAEITTLISAKAPRVFGQNPDSVANLTKRYNDLVPEAKQLGIGGVKIHTSMFGTVAGGKAVLGALEAKVAAAKQIIADATNANAQAAASGC